MSRCIDGGISFEEFCKIVQSFENGLHQSNPNNLRGVYDSRKNVGGYVSVEYASLTGKAIQAQDSVFEW